MLQDKRYTIFFKNIRKSDVRVVGGKTASLGELFHLGLPVPNGFAITAHAYRAFIKENNLDKRIKKILKNANIKRIKELRRAGAEIRSLINNARFPEKMEKEIMDAFGKLGAKSVAVRSSATAEDTETASFAGQQESFMNVTRNDLLKRVRDCFASLFTDRAISYREDKRFDHFKLDLSVAVQKQIFSKASGVLFTINPDNGHKNFIVINAGYGLGDFIVQGKIVPDEFLIFKKTCKLIEKKLGKKSLMEIRSVSGVKSRKVPQQLQSRFSITDEEAELLARYGKRIEKHYGIPQDIEWAKDKNDNLFVLQARPETVHRTKIAYKEYKFVDNKKRARVIAKGLAIGRKIASGKVNVIKDVKQMNGFKKGRILVTRQTNPDWEPIMKIAKGIIAEKGGRTSHCAIVSRELGVPAIVGVRNATRLLKNNQVITIDCTSETGKVWDGKLRYREIRHDVRKMPKTKTKIYVNIGVPDEAVDVSLLPVDGVGLAREEFIISSFVGIHPLELIRQKRGDIFVEKLASGIAKIAASFYPRPVIVRLSDFKTNEYRSLKGGKRYERKEENPMIGYRGASRYSSDFYEPAFRLECRAFKKAMGLGLDNIKIMIPFCRTIDEARKTLAIIKDEKVKAEIGVMAEIPSNIILADEFSRLFKFFSIGSNDLTQLVLAMDRDNELLAEEFDERNEAVKRMIQHLIKIAHKHKRTVSICGQAPSDFPDFTKFLVDHGIDSISVNPDVAIQTKLMVARFEG